MPQVGGSPLSRAPSPAHAARPILGFRRPWIFGFQLGIVLDRQHEGRRAFIDRYGETFSQQIVRECGADIVGEAGDEPAQLYAINTSGQALCNTNAHSGPLRGGKCALAQISGPKWALASVKPYRRTIS